MKISLRFADESPAHVDCRVFVNGAYTGTLRLCVGQEAEEFKAVIERGLADDPAYEQWWADKRDEQDREEPINVG